MAQTKIEWTATRLPDGTTLPGFTFNAWTGCAKVSAACDHCYAEAWAKRSGLVEWGAHPRRRTSEGYWRQPLKWNRIAKETGVRRKVFCCSLADVFDNQADPAWRLDLWGLIESTPHLDWLLLTKRPQNIAGMLPGNADAHGQPWSNAWPWPNVWLGCTTENQEEADRRVPHLLSIPAAKRFLSCEPLLGPVDLSLHMGSWPVRDPAKHRTDWDMRSYNEGVHWVIAGGESGPHARPMSPAWVRSLRDQCAAANVPFHLKQWGEWGPDLVHGTDLNETYRIGKKAAGAMLDGREWRESPA